MSDESGLLRRHHFLLRRLHSLSGIVPVGAFLVVHLFTNSLAAWDPKKFDEEVAWIHGLPYLIFIEFGTILLPLFFHAGYGVLIALQGQPNTLQYRYADNVRYTLQRVSGWLALAFILLHLGHFRFMHWFGASATYVDRSHEVGAFSATAEGFQTLTALWLIVYAVGLIASVYHFCNGIATFCITWGITVGHRSRQAVSLGSAGLGVLLLAWGFASLAALTWKGPLPHSEVSAAHAAVEPAHVGAER